MLGIGTERPSQTVQTQIRLLPEGEQSDLCLHCLQFHLRLLDALLQCKTKPCHFRTIMLIYLGPSILKVLRELVQVVYNQTMCSLITAYYTELNDLRIHICFRTSEVTVERISVCNVIKSWGNIAYTVYLAPEPMTSFYRHHSN